MAERAAGFTDWAAQLKAALGQPTRVPEATPPSPPVAAPPAAAPLSTPAEAVATPEPIAPQPPAPPVGGLLSFLAPPAETAESPAFASPLLGTLGAGPATEATTMGLLGALTPPPQASAPPAPIAAPKPAAPPAPVAAPKPAAPPAPVAAPQQAAPPAPAAAPAPAAPPAPAAAPKPAAPPAPVAASKPAAPPAPVAAPKPAAPPAPVAASKPAAPPAPVAAPKPAAPPAPVAAPKPAAPPAPVAAPKPAVPPAPAAAPTEASPVSILARTSALRPAPAQPAPVAAPKHATDAHPPAASANPAAAPKPAAPLAAPAAAATPAAAAKTRAAEDGKPDAQQAKPRQGRSARPTVTPADPLDDAAVAAAYQALTGAVMPASARAFAADWVAMAASITEGAEVWRALMIGMTNADVAVTGALAARARGLRTALHATEADAVRFGRMQSRLQDAGFTDGETRLLQAAVAAEPEKLQPRGALAQDLIAQSQVWDVLRLGERGIIGRLLNVADKLLAERVRWLVLVTHGRADEAKAVTVLGRGGWRLVADRPATLVLDSPRRALRPGAQIWRGPLA